MEEERVIRPRVLDQPVHRLENVGLGRLAHGIMLVVGQEHHVLALIPKVTVQIRAHVLDIVYAAAQLTPLTKVVDTNEQRFPSTVACRVLE